MRAGRLKHRIAIQTASESRGATGQVTRTWTTVKTVWAAIEPVKGEERTAAGGVEARRTHTIILRYGAYPDLTSACRFVFGPRVFEIRAAVNSFEGNYEWVCDCREVVT